MNYIREREPISRAEIARETELQRSTISAIVDALAAEGLVEEVGEGESTGGRRPTMLRLRTKEAIAIGVAITPTRTTVATSDLAGRIIEQKEFLTDPDSDKTLNQVIAVVREFSATNKGSIEAVGVSLPGLVDPSTGTAVYVPYFKWRDIPIAKTISTALGLPVSIDNDANAVALAELWFGRPEVSDARDFILVLVAEGVGHVNPLFGGIHSNSGRTLEVSLAAFQAADGALIFTAGVEDEDLAGIRIGDVDVVAIVYSHTLRRQHRVLALVPARNEFVFLLLKIEDVHARGTRIGQNNAPVGVGDQAVRTHQEVQV